MIWLQNAWYVAGFDTELTADNTVARRFLDIPVVMFRDGDGRIGALEDLCPHRLMPLSFGKRKGDTLQCGYHGLRFSVEGRCTTAPGQAQAPAAATVRTFPLAERHGLLWIWMGERTLADEALIPDMHWNHDPAWEASRGYHHVEADFRLSVDNLMDLGHESWVHQRTIGNGEEECIPDFPAQVSVEADGLVRCHREMPGIDAPPFFAMVLDHQGRINRWQTALSLAPSICMTDFGVYPVGRSPDSAYRSHVLHLLTPESPTATHYFWSVARNSRLGDAALTEMIRKAIAQTFDEDKVVLEIQQRQLAQHGGAVPRVALKVDEGPLRSRRQLAALIEREQDDPAFAFRPPLMIPEALPVLAMAA
jgi:vanillate O-demethylase monooxygenase subunit